VNDRALVRGPRVHLRHPVLADRSEYVAALERSRALLHPWVDVRLEDELIDGWFASADLADQQRLFVCRNEDGALAGAYNLSQIFYGPFRNAYLGYYAFTPHAGTGLMREGMELVLGLAFGRLALHRIQANIQPGNEASIALVRGAGFRREGFSPRYLMIGGQWRDHEQWAITVEDLGERAGAQRPAT
jgi:ribosomal-protein-alanine N-acetyltransferase